MTRASFRLIISVGVVLSIIGVGLLRVATSRAETSMQAGLSVSPGIVNIKVGKQSPTQRAELTITNDYSVPVRLVADLRSIDEQGARLVPTATLTGSFADSISLSATDIIVPAHGKYLLSVEVRDSEVLSAGGHYASLMLTEQPTGSAASSLRSAVSINLFVIKTDGVRTDLRLENTNISHSLISLPNSAALSFRNYGNTHVIPRASVGIYSMDEQTLYARSVINASSVPLFPGKTVEYTAPVELIKRIWVPKQLRIKTTYRIDGIDVELLRQSSFWYIPPIDILIVTVLGIAIWALRRKASNVVRKLYKLVIRKIAKQRYEGLNRVKGRHKMPHDKLGSVVLRAHKRSSQEQIRQKASKVLAGHLLTGTGSDSTTITKPKTRTIKVVSSPKATTVKKQGQKGPKIKKTTTKKAVKKPAKKTKPKTTKK